MLGPLLLGVAVTTDCFLFVYLILGPFLLGGDSNEGEGLPIRADLALQGEPQPGIQAYIPEDLLPHF